jgi:uncharacterized protein (DUF4213/DUF364 family)
VVQASLGKKQDPISKITRVKRVGGMAQAVQHLSSKFKVLSSNFSNTKKKKKSDVLTYSSSERMVPQMFSAYSLPRMVLTCVS